LTQLFPVSLGVGAIIGALWKKRHIYTTIHYVDVFNEEQTLVFDFEGNLELAQQMIRKKLLMRYQRETDRRRKYCSNPI